MPPVGHFSRIWARCIPATGLRRSFCEPEDTQRWSLPVGYSSGSFAGRPSSRKMPIKMIMLENPAAVHMPVSIPSETTLASESATSGSSLLSFCKAFALPRAARSTRELFARSAWAAISGSAFNCVDCVAGTYADAEGQDVCKNCDSGKFTSGVKQTKCESCEAGKKAAGAAATSCVTCDAGKVKYLKKCMIKMSQKKHLIFEKCTHAFFH